MKISSIMIVIAFILLAAALAFQTMEMKSYSLFKLTYEKYMGKPSDNATENTVKTGTADSAVNNESKPSSGKPTPADGSSEKTESQSSESSDN